MNIAKWLRQLRIRQARKMQVKHHRLANRHMILEMEWGKLANRLESDHG